MEGKYTDIFNVGIQVNFIRRYLNSPLVVGTLSFKKKKAMWEFVVCHIIKISLLG